MKSISTFLCGAMCIIVNFNNLKAQSFIDHNKKTLVNLLPNSDTKRTISVDGSSASIISTLKSYKQSGYVLIGDTASKSKESINQKPTAIDSAKYTSFDESTFLGSVAVKDINTSYKDFFTNLNQPNIELSLIWAPNNVKWINWDKLSRFKAFFKQYDLFFKVFASNTFSSYYDSSSKALSKATNWSLFNYGVGASYIGYRKHWWFSATGSLIHGMPTDNLEVYQNTLPQTINSTYPIVTMGKSTGKYGGELITNQWTLRYSLSALIFLQDINDKTTVKDKGKILSHLCIIPFYAPYGSLESKLQWYHLVGGAIGILKEGYNSQKNSNKKSNLLSKSELIGRQIKRLVPNGVSLFGFFLSKDHFKRR